MENECLLDTTTETISPPSSLKDQSLNSFSHSLTGRLGIVNLGTETVIHETDIEITKNLFSCISYNSVDISFNMH